MITIENDGFVVKANHNFQLSTLNSQLAKFLIQNSKLNNSKSQAKPRIISNSKLKTQNMITYNVDGVKMPKIKKRETTAWIRAVAAQYGYKVGEVGYMFVNDEKILEVNNEYLGHDYYTDVITFDYDEPGIVSGDIVISLDTVRTNAEKFGKEYDDELRRVIIHGILHLCGINDKGPGEREIMEAEENKALAMHP